MCWWPAPYVAAALHSLSIAKRAPAPAPRAPRGACAGKARLASAAYYFLLASLGRSLTFFTLLKAGYFFYPGVMKKIQNTLLTPATRSASRSSLWPYLLTFADVCTLLAIT